MAEVDAIADAITGAVLAGAVEPPGEGGAHTSEKQCLNCATALIGPHCHRCGQHAHVHRSLAAFFHDFAHGVFHLEGKLWRTIPLLAWKPGELTRRYIEGQRARFVSPIALFLFCVFLMFAVVEWTGSLGELPANSREEIGKQLAGDQQKLVQLQQQRAAMVTSGKATGDLDSAISELTTEMSALQFGKEQNLKLATGKLTENRQIPKLLRRMIDKSVQDPELLFFKIKTNAYKFSWALIPISVPFVWLLFPFSRRFQLYDHIVFVTYSLCFMMLLLSFGTIVGLASNSIASFCWFVPPVHMYRQLRGAYSLGVGGAIWRTFCLTIFAFIAIGLFASLLVALGAAD